MQADTYKKTDTYIRGMQTPRLPSVHKCTHALNLKKDPPQTREKKHSPPRQRGYKLGGVSITMYINSHTSF